MLPCLFAFMYVPRYVCVPFTFYLWSHFIHLALHIQDSSKQKKKKENKRKEKRDRQTRGKANGHLGRISDVVAQTIKKPGRQSV